MNVKEYLSESSLARLVKHMKNHETGIISASRKARDCGKGERYTYKENKQRTKSLLAKLQAKRYNVTSVRGSYIENYKSKDAEEVGENVFFVVDQNDRGNLLKDLKKLGTEFDQDSILFIHKGGLKGELHGTNKCPNGYPGWGKVEKYSERKMGHEGEFFTRIKGRPFMFKENQKVENHILPEGFFGRWGCATVAKKHWSEIEL
jgi:hypothetical protein